MSTALIHVLVLHGVCCLRKERNPALSNKDDPNNSGKPVG